MYYILVKVDQRKILGTGVWFKLSIYVWSLFIYFNWIAKFLPLHQIKRNPLHFLHGHSLCTFCLLDALIICNSDLTIQNASLHSSISKVSSSSTNYIYSNITILLIDFSTRHIYTFQITLHSSYMKYQLL